MQAICDDLAAEHAALDDVVATLAPAEWDRPTAAAGWSIRDAVSHLWFFDQRATMALSPDTVDAFFADAEQLLAASPTGPDASVEVGRAISPAELLSSWRQDRETLTALARTVDASARIPWYGPAMAARSFITARLMETWAHGQDVRDALGLAPLVSDRLQHVAHIGVRARPFAYRINALSMPDGDVRVELAAPDGSTWTWGESTSDRVSGPAIDFCLLATQRRHLSDVGLQIEGAGAEEWMRIVQTFAGPPGEGRQPGEF